MTQIKRLSEGGKLRDKAVKPARGQAKASSPSQKRAKVAIITPEEIIRRATQPRPRTAVGKALIAETRALFDESASRADQVVVDATKQCKAVIDAVVNLYNNEKELDAGPGIDVFDNALSLYFDAVTLRECTAKAELDALNNNPLALIEAQQTYGQQECNNIVKRAEQNGKRDKDEIEELWKAQEYTRTFKRLLQL